MKQHIIKLGYQGNAISINLENDDVMWNATHMAKPFNKKVNDFIRNSDTKSFINAFESRYGNSRIGENKAYKQIKGGNPYLQGTWMHRKLALKFAAWLNPEFELWVYETIEELLFSGKKETQPSNSNDTRLRQQFYENFTQLEEGRQRMFLYMADYYYTSTEENSKQRVLSTFDECRMYRFLPYDKHFMLEALYDLQTTTEGNLISYPQIIR